MELKKNFANSLKMIYDHSAKSLTEFASELDISRSALQAILKGDCNPRMDTVQHIAEQLNMDPLSLLMLNRRTSETEILAMTYCPIHRFVSHSLFPLSAAERAEVRAHFYQIVSILVQKNPLIKDWSNKAQFAASARMGAATVPFAAASAGSRADVHIHTRTHNHTHANPDVAVGSDPEAAVGFAPEAAVETPTETDE